MDGGRHFKPRRSFDVGGSPLFLSPLTLACCARVRVRVPLYLLLSLSLSSLLLFPLALTLVPP